MWHPYTERMRHCQLEDIGFLSVAVHSIQLPSGIKRKRHRTHKYGVLGTHHAQHPRTDF